MRLLKLLVILLTIIMSGCGSDPLVTTPDGFSVSDLEIKTNGAAIKSRPDMIDICKGFLMTEKQFSDFFRYATFVKKKNPDNEFDILPCFVKGTAYINGTPYKWIIRSGGIGEFTSKDRHFLKICGKGCCEKIAGMC